MTLARAVQSLFCNFAKETQSTSSSTVYYAFLFKSVLTFYIFEYHQTLNHHDRFFWTFMYMENFNVDRHRLLKSDVFFADFQQI
jgi:hypothetical protein